MAETDAADFTYFDEIEILGTCLGRMEKENRIGRDAGRDPIQ